MNFSVRIALVFSVLVSVSFGCIDWDGAQRSFCNVADVDHRDEVCGDKLYTGVSPNNGSTTWAARYGGEGDEQPSALLATRSGQLWVSGSVAGTGDFGLGPVAAAGAQQAFIARYDLGGAPIGAALIPELGDVATALAEGAPGALYATGYRTNGAQIDGRLVRLNADGSVVAAKSWTTASDAQVKPRTVAATSETVVVGGQLNGALETGGPVLQGHDDGWVVGLDSSFQYRWHARPTACFGTGSQALVDQIAINAHGDVFVAGRYSGSCAGVVSSATSGLRGYVAKYAAPLSGEVAPAWVIPLQTTDLTHPTSVAVDPTGGVAVTSGVDVGSTVRLHDGGFATVSEVNVSLVKLSPTDGRPLSTSVYIGADTGGFLTPEGGDATARVAVDTDGTVWVTGAITGNSLSAGGLRLTYGTSDSAYILSFNPDSNARWMRVIRGVDAPADTRDLVLVNGHPTVLGAFSGQVRVFYEQTLQGGPSTDFYLTQYNP